MEARTLHEFKTTTPDRQIETKSGEIGTKMATGILVEGSRSSTLVANYFIPVKLRIVFKRPSWVT